MNDHVSLQQTCEFCGSTFSHTLRDMRSRAWSPFVCGRCSRVPAASSKAIPVRPDPVADDLMAEGARLAVERQALDDWATSQHARDQLLESRHIDQEQFQASLDRRRVVLWVWAAGLALGWMVLLGATRAFCLTPFR